MLGLSCELEGRAFHPLSDCPMSPAISRVLLSEGHAFCQLDEPPGPLHRLRGSSAWHPEGGDVSPRKLGGEEVNTRVVRNVGN